jgi:predicted nucleotidyltransferase
MPLATEIEGSQPAIAEICLRHGVRELSLFGSAARGEMNARSDFDFLVDFLPDARPGLLGVAAMQRELSGLLGRRVDLAIKASLKPQLSAGIPADSLLVYRA